MNENFNIEVCNVFKMAEEERQNLHHPYVGSEHLLLALLKDSENIKNIAADFNLTYESFKSELIRVIGIAKKNIEVNLYTPLLKRVINSSLEETKEKSKKEVTKEQLFLSIIDEGEGVAIRILLGMDIDIDKLYNEIKNSTKGKKVTNELKYGKNLNELVDMQEQVIKRDEEINFIIETLLRKKKNNPLLIGDAGVGKTAIVEQLARKINNKEVPIELQSARIIMLEMGSLVANTKYRGEFEDKLNKVINYLKDTDILFVDEIHSMVNAGGADGAISAGDILKPYLARNKVKLIGATTTEEYNKYILPDKALVRRFETINVLEPDKQDTIEILQKVKKEYENHHKIKINNKNIELIVSLTEEYLPSLKNPDKSLDFLDSVCSYARLKNNNLKENHKYQKRLLNLKSDIESCLQKNDFKTALELKKEEVSIKEQINRKKQKNLSIKSSDIYKVLETKCHIPINIDHKKLKYNLDINLSKVIGQDESIRLLKEKILTSLHKKHLTSILIQGTSGIGKNYCIKQIANSFKKSTKYLTINAKDFRNYNDLYKLLGIPSGPKNYLFSSIKNNQFFIMEVTHIEYASEELINLLQKIIDEEQIVDNFGNYISFKNAYLFLTSTKLPSNLGFDKNKIDTKMILNNLDLILDFNNLTKTEIIKILKNNDIEYNEEDLKLYCKEGLKTINKKIVS